MKLIIHPNIMNIMNIIMNNKERRQKNRDKEPRFIHVTFITPAARDIGADWGLERTTGGAGAEQPAVMRTAARQHSCPRPGTAAI